jgi:excisionase family DNA binding protein
MRGILFAIPTRMPVELNEKHPTRRAPDMATVRTRPDGEALLTPSEVATLFRVDPKTVTRWAKAGKLASIRTLGGHRRYRESEVRSLLAGNTTENDS